MHQYRQITVTLIWNRILDALVESRAWFATFDRDSITDHLAGRDSPSRPDTSRSRSETERGKKMDYIVDPIQVVQLLDLNEVRLGDKTPVQKVPLTPEIRSIDLEPPPCTGKCLVCDLG